MDQIVTTAGENFIDFHRRLLALRPAFSDLELCDGSEWFASHGPTARHYYTALLALFVQHGILFESFLLSPAEQQFTSEVVFPSFEAAAALHGRRPLICRLDPPIVEGGAFWLQYPDELYSAAVNDLSLAVPTAIVPLQKNRASAETSPGA